MGPHSIVSSVGDQGWCDQCDEYVDHDDAKDDCSNDD